MKNIFNIGFLFALSVSVWFVGSIDNVKENAYAHYNQTTVMTFGNTPGVQIQTQSITRVHTTPSEIPINIPTVTISAATTTSTVVATSSVPVTPHHLFDTNLGYGVSGPQIKLLQTYLNTHGYIVRESGFGSTGNETEYFGNATRAALIKFQKANGITPASGYFGPVTREFVNSK